MLPIPNLSFSTGPQVLDGRSGGTFAPSFGGDFFGRSAVAGMSPEVLLLLAAAGIGVFLLVSGKVKI